MLFRSVVAVADLDEAGIVIEFGLDKFFQNTNKIAAENQRLFLICGGEGTRTPVQT